VHVRRCNVQVRLPGSRREHVVDVRNVPSRRIERRHVQRRRHLLPARFVSEGSCRLRRGLRDEPRSEPLGRSSDLRFDLLGGRPDVQRESLDVSRSVPFSNSRRVRDLRSMFARRRERRHVRRRRSLLSESRVSRLGEHVRALLHVIRLGSGETFAGSLW
jgi:hypothetical protein